MLRLADTTGRAMTGVSIALMLVLCLPVTYEAVARYLGAPTIWVFETTLYAFIFLGFLGNALAVRSGAHFRVTLLIQAFPRHKRFFDLIAHGATLIMAVLIITSGAYFVWYSYSNVILSATLLEIPLWIPQLAVPIGGIGLFLQTLVVIARGEDKTDLHTVGD